MALTQEDLQAIQSTLQPQFDAIHTKLDQHTEVLQQQTEELEEIQSAVNDIGSCVENASILIKEPYPPKQAQQISIMMSINNSLYCYT